MREFKTRYLLIAAVSVTSIGVIIISLILKYRQSWVGPGIIIFVFLPGLALNIYFTFSFAILKQIDSEQFKHIRRSTKLVLLMIGIAAIVIVLPGFVNLFTRVGENPAQVFLILVYVAYGFLILTPFITWIVFRWKTRKYIPIDIQLQSNA